VAVLPRPAARYVRGPHQAIAIVDLADDGTSLPPVRRRSKGRGRVAAATFGSVLGLMAGLAPLAVDRSAAQAPDAPPAAARPALAPVGGGSAVTTVVLALPPGVTDADLSAIPDRYVNEPLPPSFRVPLRVRGVAAVASAEPPFAITWTEGGLAYLLTSRARTIAQLVDLASRLR